MKIIKGRGAQINTSDPFARHVRSDLQPDQEEVESGKYRTTDVIRVYPKTIVNEVKSPDVGMDYSINPYQGCEHGCIYCYARNSHPYWGYNAGLEFESKIMVKMNAPVLLSRFLSAPSWKATPIVLSGNTDCYQPVENEYKITRSLLEIFLSFQHPVGIITKNALISRDLDLLEALSRYNLIKVIISVTTLSEDLRQLMEPRTATIEKRLETIRKLSRAGIPVSVMVAPIIPGLNSHEVMEIIRICAEAGAIGAGFTIVRLNGDVGTIFQDWLTKTMPDRSSKIMHQIAACHGGKIQDSRFGVRMKGEGVEAQMIRDQFKLAVQKYMNGGQRHVLNTDLFNSPFKGQMELEF